MKARYGVVAPYILYVGNFLPHKNVPTLLRAYAALPGPVRTGHGALPEVVADAGLRVDASRETELAAAMVRVLSDAGLSDDLRRRGLARAPLYWSDRIAGRVLALLDDVAEANVRGPVGGPAAHLAAPRRGRYHTVKVPIVRSAKPRSRSAVASVRSCSR